MSDSTATDVLFDRALRGCTATTPQEAAEVFMLCWNFVLHSDTGTEAFLTMNIDDLFEYRYRLLLRTASLFEFEPKGIAVFLDFPVEPKWLPT
jgi:hypothetical protein